MGLTRNGCEAVALQTFSPVPRNQTRGWEITLSRLVAGTRKLTGDERSVEEILSEHRKSIDRLDAILIYALGERFQHTQAVGGLKAKHNLPASDPEREARQIARLKKLAACADLDPEFATSFINFVIREVIRHHMKHKEQSVILTTAQDKE